MREHRNSPVLAMLAAVAVLGLAVSYFFLPADVVPERAITDIRWLSIVLALACFCVTAVSMGLLNYSSFLFTSDTRLLYLPYLVTVLSIPGAMHLGPYHVSALLMIWSVFYAMRYVESEHVRMGYAFGVVIFAGTASMLVPSMVYAEIYIFLFCFYVRGQAFVRYLLSSIAAASVPWIYVLSWCYLRPESLQTVEYLRFFREGMALSLPEIGGMPLMDMIWAGFCLLLGLRAIVFVLARGRERNKAQKNAFGLSVALSVVCLLATVFCREYREPLSVIVTAVPFSFLVFDLFTNGRRIEAGLWISLLVLAAAAMRVSEFLPGLLQS